MKLSRSIRIHNGSPPKSQARRRSRRHSGPANGRVPGDDVVMFPGIYMDFMGFMWDLCGIYWVSMGNLMGSNTDVQEI